MYMEFCFQFGALNVVGLLGSERCTVANGKMRAYGDAGLQFSVSRVRDKVRVSVRDRIGARISDNNNNNTMTISNAP